LAGFLTGLKASVLKPVQCGGPFREHQDAQRIHEATLYSFFLRLGAPWWLKILQCFGKFQPLKSKRCCPAMPRTGIDNEKNPGLRSIVVVYRDFLNYL
jgi:hypothetical protein